MDGFFGHSAAMSTVSVFTVIFPVAVALTPRAMVPLRIMMRIATIWNAGVEKDADDTAACVSALLGSLFLLYTTPRGMWPGALLMVSVG